MGVSSSGFQLSGFLAHGVGAAVFHTLAILFWGSAQGRFDDALV